MKKKKSIYLRDETDFDKFVRKLPFYNSFLFRNASFEVLGNNFNMKDEIVRVLNIKNRREKLRYIVDAGCNYIDDFFGEKNICGFKNCKCYVQRKNKSEFYNGCCRKCIYQSSKGCTTKNVACKLFFCSEVKCRNTVITFDDINLFKCLTFRQKYILKNDYFSKVEDVTTDLYFNSLIIGFARLFFRTLFNYFKFKSKN